MKRDKRDLRRKGRSMLVMLALGLVASGCQRTTPRRPQVGPPESLSIGVPKEPLGALIVVAADQGLFADQGLDVALVDRYPSGKRALSGMLEREVELTISSEVPLTFQAFDRNDFRILATVGVSDNEPRVIGRRDAGIDEPDDLRGKRVATQRASAVHYFLHLFLLRQGIATDDIDLSFVRAEELPPALAEGRIDAFSMREPFIGQAKSLIGDQPQLVQLMTNLVGNAIKYHADRTPLVHVSAEAQGDAWRLSVRDNGIGIDARHFESIFEIFRRLHTEQAYPGTGIGLAVCRRIVHRHSGEIWVDSEPGLGSNFFFTLPVQGAPS